MKIALTIFALGAFIWTESNAFMDIDYFDTIVRPACSGRLMADNTRELINGQQLPSPNTIESFIGLVENLEILHPEWRPADVIRRLLYNFRYDDAEVRGKTVATRGTTAGVSKYYETLLKLFKVSPSRVGQEFRPADLTQDERCALYYMISHTVNSTIHPGDEVIDRNGIKYPKYLREQGVVTLSSQKIHAFALGKVLLGLLAGLERSDPASASNIYSEVKGNVNNVAPPLLEKVLVNVLYAATFGDVVSVSKDELKDNYGQNIEPCFYSNGYWSEEVCPVHYLIDNSELQGCHASYSLVRGAVDGYRLGTHIKSWTDANSNLKISQVLRAYYTGQGTVSWCNRRDLVFTSLRQEAIDFDKLYSAVTDKRVDDDAVQQGVDKILGFLDQKNENIYNDATRDANKCDNKDIVGNLCDTPSHILAVLDMRAREYRDQQSEVIGNLTSGMHMGQKIASSISMYTNLKPYRGDHLDIALNHTTVSGCGGCAAKHYDPQRGNAESEAEVFRDLNVTLGEITSDSEKELAAPAKVILYFNYGAPTWETYLQRALDEIRWRYRSVKIIAVGTKKDNLRHFTDEKYIETGMTPMKMESLKEKVCKVPALFQYENCYRRDVAQERSELFTGVLTTRHFQYWMMEPKYFLKSFNIKLFFKATSGEIRVCFSRSYSQIFDYKDQSGANCKKSSGEDIMFEVNNPCHRQTEASCDPFYFYLEGKVAPRDNERCTELVCRTEDQITYEFRHEGVSCNGGNVLATVKLPLILFLAMTIWKFACKS